MILIMGMLSLVINDSEVPLLIGLLLRGLLTPGFLMVLVMGTRILDSPFSSPEMITLAFPREIIFPQREREMLIGHVSGRNLPLEDAVSFTASRRNVLVNRNVDST
mmetsp:Transcript_15584/g.25596  ORF Transcript_15584/g.25596 Transcript_15584/m.25596 type:complete len:106 (+) Transcript_15584:1770-2087(+)